MNLSDVARLERESGCKPVSDTKQRIDRSLRHHCPNGQLHPRRELLSDERSDGADLHCQLVRVHHYGPVSPTPVSSHIFMLAAACDPAPPKSSSNADARNRTNQDPHEHFGADHPPRPDSLRACFAGLMRLGIGFWWRLAVLAPGPTRVVPGPPPPVPRQVMASAACWTKRTESSGCRAAASSRSTARV